MQTDLISISRIFTECLYRIPDYQRGYSWREKQLREFFADVEQLDKGKNHYTGVLTLEEVSEAEHEKWDDDRWIIQSKRYVPYFVVDGQQRLTTIVIFLQCIIERLGQDEQVNFTDKNDVRRKFIFESKDGGISRSYLFGYQKDNPSSEFLKTEIFGENSEKHRPPEDTIYTYNLQKAKSFFADRIKDLPLETVEAYYTKITQQLLFNIYTMSNDIDVFVAFETMNNRGKPLSHLEILKNRLIYISTKLDADQEERLKLREVVNDCWKAAYNYLGKNRDRPLDDNHFLLSHFYLHFGQIIVDETGGRSVSGRIWEYAHDDSYKDYLLNEVFNIKNLRQNTDQRQHSLTVSYVYKYAHDLSASVKLYYQIANPHDSRFSSDEKKFLERLQRINGIEPELITLSVYLTEKKKEVRLKFLTIWERIRFLTSIVPYIRGIDDFSPKLLAISLRIGAITTENLIEQLEKILLSIQKNIDFKSAMKEWVKRYGYYGWRGLKYFYFEYEEHLKSISKTKRQKLVWDDFSSEDFEADFCTIEHIYPQRADTQEWKDNFIEYSVKEKNILRNSLGNLIALSQPKNSSLGRKNFIDKKSNSDNSVGYSYGCYSENEIALNEEWTARQIALRGVRMLIFMEHRWGITLGSNKEKLLTLGLEFCLPKNRGLAADLAKVTL